MKILHVNTELGWRGGERQLKLLVEGQLQAGLAPTLLAREGSAIGRELGLLGVDIILLPGRNPVGFSTRLRQLVQFCPQQFDLIHAHTSHAHSWGLLLQRRIQVPLIVHRRVDFVPGASWLEDYKYHDKSVYYVAVSHAIQEILEQRGISPNRIQVVHSAVPAPVQLTSAGRSKLLESLRLSPEQVVVGSVGALVGHKGHKVLISAWPGVVKRYSQVKLLIMGDGPLRYELEHLAKSLGVADSISFLGHREDVHELQQLLSLQIAPSLEEGLNTSLLDALHLEIPIIASRCGGIPEVVEGVGTLVPPGNPEALSRAICGFLQAPELLRAKAAAGRLRAQELFDVSRMQQRMAEVYQQVVRDYAAQSRSH